MTGCGFAFWAKANDDVVQDATNSLRLSTASEYRDQSGVGDGFAAMRWLKRFSFLVCLITLPVFSQQPETERIPKLLPESADTVDKRARAARSKVYDVPGHPSLLEVRNTPPIQPGVPPPPPPGTIVDLIPLPELPLDESEAVVVGEVTNVQPFLTFSQASLYMESTIRVLDIIKSRAKAPIKDSLVVLRRGGMARLEGGRVIAWNVHDEGDHYQTGEQYLFFLAYREEPDAYLVQKAWRVQDGVIKAVYPGDQAKASQFLSESDGRVLTEVVRTLKARTEQIRN